MIIYYTGTGNSRYVAEAAADYLQDDLVDTHAYIKGHKVGDFNSQKPYIFCSPTYAWRLPVVFSDFIRASHFSGNKAAYFFMTCGDDVGNAAAHLKKLCQEKSLNFRGLYPVIMPENYIAMFTVPDQAESQKIIAAAGPGLKQSLELIRQDQDLTTPSKNVLDSLKSGPINALFRKFIVKSKAFRVTEACIGCKRCANHCVMNNISMQDQKPVWASNCIHCMDCICACPVEAIEYGRKSVGQPRYECPPYAGDIRNA